MNNNKTIRIKNELPELLEAVCNHADCPEWLQDAIWESFNGQEMRVTFSATWWRAQFETITPAKSKTNKCLPNEILDAEVIDEK